MKLFNDDLIIMKADVQSNIDAISLGGKLLLEKGYVKDSYIPFVIQREKEAPTGIPTQSIKVSLPHTDTEHVIKPGAVFIQLNHPVEFVSMEDLTSKLPVELVFQLALTDGRQQIAALKSLMSLFYDSNRLIQLRNATTKEEIIDILSIVEI